MSENGLTTTQQRQLQHHEALITKGVGDVYNSLRMIHDQKLFLGTHAKFEDYCQDRWGIGRSRAFHLLKHGQILKLIEDNPSQSAIADSIRESHTREVGDLPPEEAAAIIMETAERNDGKVTASAVRDTRSSDPFDVPEGANGEETISSEGQEAQDSSPRPPRSGKARSGGSKTTLRTPEHEFDIQRSKTVKTVEAAIRAFDDLNSLQKMPEWHDTAIDEAKSLLSKAQNWKYANR